jgi:hypothetical protein
VLHEHRVDGRVVVEAADRGDDVAVGRVVPSRSCGLVNPSSSAFFIFMPT